MSNQVKINIDLPGRSRLQAAEDLRAIAKAVESGCITNLPSRLLFGKRAVSIQVTEAGGPDHA